MYVQLKITKWRWVQTTCTPYFQNFTSSIRNLTSLVVPMSILFSYCHGCLSNDKLQTTVINKHLSAELLTPFCNLTPTYFMSLFRIVITLSTWVLTPTYLQWKSFICMIASSNSPVVWFASVHDTKITNFRHIKQWYISAKNISRTGPQRGRSCSISTGIVLVSQGQLKQYFAAIRNSCRIQSASNTCSDINVQKYY